MAGTDPRTGRSMTVLRGPTGTGFLAPPLSPWFLGSVPRDATPQPYYFRTILFEILLFVLAQVFADFVETETAKTEASGFPATPKGSCPSRPRGIARGVALFCQRAWVSSRRDHANTGGTSNERRNLVTT